MKWKDEKKNFDWSWREEPLSDRFGYMNNLLFKNINRYHLNFVLTIILNSNKIKEQRVFVIIMDGYTLDYIKVFDYPSSKSHYLKITALSPIYDGKVELNIYGDLGYGHINFYFSYKKSVL